MVIAKSFARIHWQNLANFGVLAVEFVDPADYDTVEQYDTLRLENLRDALGADDVLTVRNVTKVRNVEVRHRLSKRQVSDVLAGGLIPRLAAEEHPDEHRAEETVLQDSGEIS